MAEEVYIDTNLSRAEAYEALLPQIQALIAPETNLVANLSNVMAALKYGLNFFWVGCYLVEQEELVLGPFQGPVACTRIQFGQGVCGAAWKSKSTIIVPDVDQFPGHIACSSETRSEIVVPVKNNSGEVIMVLDVDSTRLNDFSETDQVHLEKLAEMLAKKE